MIFRFCKNDTSAFPDSSNLFQNVSRETFCEKSLTKDSRETFCEKSLTKDSRETFCEKSLTKDSRETFCEKSLMKDSRETFFRETGPLFHLFPIPTFRESSACDLHGIFRKSHGPASGNGYLIRGPDQYPTKKLRFPASFAEETEFLFCIFCFFLTGF